LHCSLLFLLACLFPSDLFLLFFSLAIFAFLLSTLLLPLRGAPCPTAFLSLRAGDLTRLRFGLTVLRFCSSTSLLLGTKARLFRR
jgi:hypothetical protein